MNHTEAQCHFLTAGCPPWLNAVLAALEAAGLKGRQRKAAEYTVSQELLIRAIERLSLTEEDCRMILRNTEAICALDQEEASGSTPGQAIAEAISYQRDGGIEGSIKKLNDEIAPQLNRLYAIQDRRGDMDYEAIEEGQ